MIDDFTYQLTYFDESDFAEKIHRQIERDFPGCSKVEHNESNKKETCVMLSARHKNFCDFYVNTYCRISDKPTAKWALDKADKIAEGVK